METKYKKGLTLGDLITAAYQVWGAVQAEKMVRWAINTRLVVPRGHPHLSISSSEARVPMNKAIPLVGALKIGLGVALVASLAGCVGYVDGGGGGTVVVGGPGYIDGGFGGGYDRGRDVHGFSGRGVASRAAAHGGGGARGGGGGKR